MTHLSIQFLLVAQFGDALIVLGAAFLMHALFYKIQMLFYRLSGGLRIAIQDCVMDFAVLVQKGLARGPNLEHDFAIVKNTSAQHFKH